MTFARAEGIVPAPESAHAIKGVLDAARRADEEGLERVILFNLSGHGHFDMSAYDAYLHGRLEDHDDALIRVDAVRMLAAGRVGPSWDTHFAFMLAYADTKGWLHDDGQSLQAHCEWPTP